MGYLIIYAGLFVCGVIALSFTIVVGFTLYFSYSESAARKLYKSKVITDKKISMSGLSKPTRPAPPMPKCKPNRKEPCCECDRSILKYRRYHDRVE